MTINEAIKHCKEVTLHCNNKECACGHQQLAEWLEELLYYRKLNNMEIILLWIIAFIIGMVLVTFVDNDITIIK